MRLSFSILLTFLVAGLSLSTSANVCKEDQVNKITICHAGNDNGNPAAPHFVNICVDFAAVHGHLKEHDLDSVGACGATELTDDVLYACNAGIKHVTPSSRVCYQRTNPSLSCNPNACLDGQSCDCVCSGVNGGANNVDFMSYSGRSFSELSELSQIGDDNFWQGTRASKTSAPLQNNGYVDAEGFVVATNTPLNYVLRSEALSFNLGSEQYGAEYFVDVCWQNTNENNIGKFEILPTYGFKNKTFFGDTYVSSADVFTKTDVECIDSDDQIFDIFDEDYLMFPGQMQELSPFVGTVNNVSSCRVRHYFKENSEQFRAWQLNAIDVSTLLDVSLTPDQPVPADKGVRLCHPISFINNNGVRVSTTCQLRFESSDAYKSFVLHHHDIARGHSNSTYSVNHNFDYRALDGETCGRYVAPAAFCQEKMNLIENDIHSQVLTGTNELYNALNINF